MQSSPIATAGNAETELQVAVRAKHIEIRKKLAECRTRLDELMSQGRELGVQDSEVDALCNKFKHALQVQELDANSVIARKDASSCKTIPMSSEDYDREFYKIQRLFEQCKTSQRELGELLGALRREKEHFAGAATAEI